MLKCIRCADVKMLQCIWGNVLNGFPRTWQPATSNPLPLCASLFFPQLSSSKATWVYLLFWPKTARGLSADVSETTVIGYFRSREGLRSRRAGQNLRPPGSLSTSALTEMRQTRKEGDRRERTASTWEEESPRKTSAMNVRCHWGQRAQQPSQGVKDGRPLGGTFHRKRTR